MFVAATAAAFRGIDAAAHAGGEEYSIDYRHSAYPVGSVWAGS
jgi:hypothetical protein